MTGYWKFHDLTTDMTYYYQDSENVDIMMIGITGYGEQALIKNIIRDMHFENFPGMFKKSTAQEFNQAFTKAKQIIGL